MAKKRRKQPPQAPSTADYYKLKTKAVDDLVTADASNSPQVSKAELARYGARKKNGWPGWLKTSFAKWWFAGAVFFFMAMTGITGEHPDPFFLILIVGIVLGVVNDLLTNNMIRFMANTDGENDCFLMFAKQRYITFPLNILYSLVLCAVVFLAVYPLAGLLVDLNAVPRSFLADIIEGPIGFGLFYVLCDSLLVLVKGLILKAVRSVKNKNVQEG